MKHEQMLQKAELIASILCQCSNNLAYRKVNDMPLLASLSISCAASNRDIEALDPRFKEILLFGSTARGAAEPGDIDMMVFDSGFYSNLFDFEPTESAMTNTEPYSSWGGKLQKNLEMLLDGWFGYNKELHQLDDVLVDLQVLPITIITTPAVRRRVGEKHTDKNFFSNAFSTILRFDERAGKFLPTTLHELEEKHQGVIA